MVSFTCDKCGEKVERAKLRSGRVSHLTEQDLTFELCPNCFINLQTWIEDTVGGERQDGREATGAERR